MERSGDRGGYRDRQRHLPRSAHHDPARGLARNGVRRLGGGRSALAGRRTQLCGTGRGHARGWRRVRLSARSLRAGVGIPLWLDADVGGQERLHRHTGDRIFLLPDEFSAAIERSFTCRAAADWSPRRAARDPLRPDIRHGADPVSRSRQLFRSQDRRRGPGGGYGGQSGAYPVHYSGGPGLGSPASRNGAHGWNSSQLRRFFRRHGGGAMGV